MIIFEGAQDVHWEFGGSISKKLSTGEIDNFLKKESIWSSTLLLSHNHSQPVITLAFTALAFWAQLLSANSSPTSDFKFCNKQVVFFLILIQNLTMQCSNHFEHLYQLYWLSVEGGLERDIQDNIHRNGIFLLNILLLTDMAYRMN